MSTARLTQSLRDMVLSLVALLVLLGGILAFTKGCSFSPGGPTVDPSSAPTVDVSTQLGVSAASVPFTLRQPVVPEQWHANSANVAPVGTGGASTVAVRVGWLTGNGGYLRLSQSDASAMNLAAAESGRGTETLRPTGAVTVGDRRWITYPAHDTEPSWVTTVDGVSLLITGSAGEDDFRALAAAAVTAPVVPRS